MIENLQSFLSGLADNYRTNEIDKRELEHRLLELIADEIDNNALDRATWLKAFSEADADERRAKALYIKYRKERLMDQISAIGIQLKRQAAARKVPEPTKPVPRRSREELREDDKQVTKEIGYVVLIFGSVLIAALLALVLFEGSGDSSEYNSPATLAEDTSRADATTYATPILPDTDPRWQTDILYDYFDQPDVAGHYKLISVSCGTECSINFLANQETGEFYRLALGGEEMGSLEFATERSSDYILAQWRDWDDEVCRRQLHYWDGNSLTQTGEELTLDLVEESRACPPFD